MKSIFRRKKADMPGLGVIIALLLGLVVMFIIIWKLYGAKEQVTKAEQATIGLVRQQCLPPKLSIDTLPGRNEYRMCACYIYGGTPAGCSQDPTRVAFPSQDCPKKCEISSKDLGENIIKDELKKQKAAYAKAYKENPRVDQSQFFGECCVVDETLTPIK